MKVLIFGTFDGLHKGHLAFIKQAKRYGNCLAIVARDRNVKKIKGKLPDKKEKQRLKELKKVVAARLGNLNNPFKVIEEEKPDLICLGYDQKSFIAGLKGLGIKIVRLKSYKPKIYHSSIIKKNARYKQNKRK